MNILPLTLQHVSSIPTIRQNLEGLDDPRQPIFLNVHDEVADIMSTTPSSSAHQNWDGGQGDHIAMGMRICKVLYSASTADYGPLPFPLARVIVAYLFHDWEKVARQAAMTDLRFCPYQQMVEQGIAWEAVKFVMLRDLQRQKRFTLFPDEIDGIRCAHGERWAIPMAVIQEVFASADLSLFEAGQKLHQAYRDQRDSVNTSQGWTPMSPLAAMICAADLLSARCHPFDGQGIAFNTEGRP